MGKSSYSYVSAAAPQIEAFVRTRTAMGAMCDSYAKYLHHFDSFAARGFPEAGALSQGMVDGWFEPRPTEVAKSCRTRCEPVAALVRFLRWRGETDVVVPDMPRVSSPGSYVPHSFTDAELSAFFALCDSWRPPANMPEARALRTKYTLPVLFRLLWSSGMRTTEVRLLRRGCVDLGEGVVHVVAGKGMSERIVALHPSMAELMRAYDGRMDEVMPGRAYFFPNEAGTHLSSRWLSDQFRRMWGQVSDEPAVAYELRHCYCTTAIDRLVGRGVDGLRDLQWVSSAMGHKSVEVTIRHYYHIVPGLARLLQERCEDGFDVVAPDARGGSGEGGEDGNE